MSKMKSTVWIVITVAALLSVALAATALAAGQERQRQGNHPAIGQQGEPGGQFERGKGMLQRVVFGNITSISGNTLTVKPELPPELLDRLAEHGVESPQLPDAVSLVVNDDSKLFMSSGPAQLGDFKTGDKIVAFCDKAEDGSSRKVLRMADADTARQMIAQRMQGQGGPGGGQGMGRGGEGGPGRFGQDQGPGGEGGLRDKMRPVFGTITSLTDDSVTIKIEIPDFVLDRMQENGRELPADIPSEVTLKYGDRTRFIVNGEPVDGMPFKVGDQVVAMGIKLEGDVAAAAIADMASAKQRMEEGGGHGMGPGGPQGPPQDGAGQPGAGGHGRRARR